MKKIILHLILSSVCISMYAYEPMLVKGRMWTEKIFCDVTMDGQNTYTYSDSIWIEKDTIINDLTYVKFSDNRLIMREDIEKQEVYTRINDVDLLHYKFNVNKGDTLRDKDLIDKSYLPIHLIVDSIYVLNNHKTIKLHPFLVDDSEDYEEYWQYLKSYIEEHEEEFAILWMEGVGDIGSSSFYRRIWDIDKTGGCSYALLCVQDNDSSYYPLNMTKVDCYVAYTGTGKFALSVDNKVVAESLHAYLEGNTLKVVIPDNETLISISLFDITGKEVYCSSSSSLCHQLILPQGIYYVVVQTQNRIYSTKVIKR